MPALATTDALLDVLRASKLLDESQLADYLKRSAGLPEAPLAAARRLVQDGLITAFQAEQLLAGRHKGYFLMGGQYKVLRPIGKGGMGTVFLCRHVKLNRLSAVKVMPKEQARDKVALERFQREARAAAALDHPNIVRVHDVSATPALALLVMEYVEGKTLQQILDAAGPLPYPRAVSYAVQAAAGLAHAHERGIIHRDIKPANLLVDGQGTVKILDMGLARFLTTEAPLTAKLDAANVLGTADYMSPEQAIAGSQVDARTDIYSLGATLYTLLSGKPPFDGTATQKLLSHQVRDALPAHKVHTEVPKGLSAIVARMMAKKPADRFGSAAEVIAALTPWTEAPQPAHTTGQRAPLPAPKRAFPLKAVLIGAGSAVALLVVAVVSGLVYSLQAPTAQGGVAAPPTGATGIVLAKPPAPLPANPQPAEKVLYRLSLSGQEPFVTRIENRMRDGPMALPDT